MYRDILLLKLETGIRIGEVIGLTWERCDLAAGWVYFGKHDNKSKRPRTVALSVKAVELISKQPKYKQWVFLNKGDKVKYQTFIKAFHKARIKAGVGHCTPHDFRRTFGYRKRRGGVELDALQAQFGHKSRTTTERVYARVDQERARESVLAYGKAL